MTLALLTKDKFMYVQKQLCLLAIFSIVATTACSKEVAQKATKSWHSKFNWKAEDYFDDPVVIALCRAIELNDIKKIDRLVADGADVNAQGKGKMTPLLWAFPDNRPARFKRLLEHGANPNIIIKSDFNTNMSGMVPGESVTLMACSTWFPKYFDYVFLHGGDPNLAHHKDRTTPLFALIRGPAKEKKRKVQKLIDLGANIDANKGYQYTGGSTPIMVAASCFGQYDLALVLLQAGADFKVRKTVGKFKLVNIVLREASRLAFIGPKQRADYKKLVQWLDEQGESLEEAKATDKNWKSWVKGEALKMLMKIEHDIATHKAKEQQEKEAKMPDGAKVEPTSAH